MPSSIVASSGLTRGYACAENCPTSLVLTLIPICLDLVVSCASGPFLLSQFLLFRELESVIEIQAHDVHGVISARQV